QLLSFYTCICLLHLRVCLLFLRVPVEVNVSNGARSLHVSGILMNGRRAPSTERLEVVEVGLKIVVGPPEGVLAHAIPVDADDALPVVVVRVDSGLDTKGVALRHHIENELSVGVLVRSPVVDLNVEPEHAELGSGVLQCVHGVLHLNLGGLAGRRVAGEEVRINVGHSSGPGVLDVLDAGLVDASIALADSADVEVVAVALEAGEARGGDGGNRVYSEVSSGERDAEGEK
ncbi:hypothetical protein PMAYCL1PPCAC_26533, partial [Pristionchus mayeri]